MLRAFVSYLHECSYARTTIARRLACLRSLFRYTTREGITESNPAKALRTPRIGRSLPKFLSTPQINQLLDARSPANPWESATGRCWRPCTPPDCASRSSWG